MNRFSMDQRAMFIYQSRLDAILTQQTYIDDLERALETAEREREAKEREREAKERALEATKRALETAEQERKAKESAQEAIERERIDKGLLLIELNKLKEEIKQSLMK